MKKVERSGIYPWLFTALAALVVRIPDYWLPLNRDGGMFAYGGWRILHGELPYIHFWDNKLPGVFYINALAIKLFGATPPALVTFLILYGTATAIVFYAVARKLCGKRAALIVSLLFAFYHGSYGLAQEGNYTESYVALPALLGVLALLKWNESHKRWLLPALAGALGTAALLIKQPAAAVIPAMALWAVMGKGRRNWFTGGMVICGAAAVVGATTLWMTLKGMLPLAIDANVEYNRLYFFEAYSATGWESSLWGLKCGLVRTALPLAGAIAGLVMLCVRGARFSRLAYLLAPWFLLDLVGVAMGGRFYDHYFLGMLPSSFLLTGVFLSGLTTCRSFIVVAVLGLILFFGPAWRLSPPTGWTNLESEGSIAEREWRALKWIAERRIGLGKQSAAEEISAWIRSHSKATDTIYVWGYDPRIGFLAQRAFPSRYVHIHPLGADSPRRAERIREVARDLQSRKPRYIVDESPLLPTTAPPLDSTKAPRSVSPMFLLDGYEPVIKVVKQHYRPVAVVAGCTVYEVR